MKWVRKGKCKQTYDRYESWEYVDADGLVVDAIRASFSIDPFNLLLVDKQKKEKERMEVILGFVWMDNLGVSCN